MTTVSALSDRTFFTIPNLDGYDIFTGSFMFNPGTEVAGNGTQRKRRVLIVDDHPIFRVGLADLIRRRRRSSHLDVCGNADCAPAALDAMRNLKPDLGRLDLSPPGTKGVELMKSMKAERPDLAIIVIGYRLSPEASLQGSMRQSVGPTKFARSQPAGPKLCPQSPDLLAASSPPSLYFFAFAHPPS